MLTVYVFSLNEFPYNNMDVFITITHTQRVNPLETEDFDDKFCSQFFMIHHTIITNKETFLQDFF